MPDSHHSNGQRCQRTIKLSTQIKSSGLNKSSAELKIIITTKVTVVRNSQRRLKVGETWQNNKTNWQEEIGGMIKPS